MIYIYGYSQKVPTGRVYILLLVPFSEFWIVVGTVLITSVLSVLVVELVVVLIVLVHMYVAGSVLQCPSPVQLAVMMTLGNKPSSQVKVMKM